jgi:hypothetical protein
LDAEYSDIQWEDVLSTMCVPPARALTSQTGGTSGRGGEGGSLVNARLEQLKDLLKQDPDCLAFLNSKGQDALQDLSDFIQFGLVGESTIPPTTDSNGQTYMTNAQNASGIPNQSITLNTIGAFFKASYQGVRLTTDRNRIEGGTVAAQLFILLHELGHNTTVLVPDANKQALVDQNDKTLERKCKKTIGSFPK